MPSPAPNFSPFPFAQLRTLRRGDAAIESVIARWIAGLAARPTPSPAGRLGKLVGATRISLLGVRAPRLDPYAALAEVRVHGHSVLVAASGAFARQLAQQLLGGMAELAAPRPLAEAEHAMFALAVAAGLEDARLPGEVWPTTDEPALRDAFARATVALAFAVTIAGFAPIEVVVALPPALLLAVPPARPWPTWAFEVPILVATCAVDAAHRLAVRDVIVVERSLGLVLGEGLFALRAAPGAVEATVVNEYVRRDMALPDDAHLELSVQLGTTRLSLRQLAELAPGTVVPLGRPLAGPFEVRVAGRLVGQGELVDVDGELGVRIVSLQE